MGSAIIPIKNLTSVMVSEYYPTKNYNYTAALGLRNDTGIRGFAFMKFALPFPLGAKITSAKLQMWSMEAAWTGGLRTVQCMKVIGGNFDPATITWNNRPTASSTGAVNVAKTNPPGNTMWEFDVQALMQGFSDGTPWYGLRFNLLETEPTQRNLYNHKGPSNYVPVLLISWSEAPDAADELSPSDGRAVSLARPTFTANFFDPNGNNSLASIQVKIGTTSDVDASTIQDSGDFATDSPQWTATADIALNALRWWKVRFKDNDGNWGAYSAATSFIRRAKGTVAINSPTGGTVTDATPTVAWTVGGGATQRAYQVLLYDITGGITLVHDSGKKTSTDTAYTLPPTAIKLTGHTYRAEVRIWDQYDRATTPGDDAFITDTEDFVFGTGATSAVTNFTISDDPSGKPWMLLDVEDTVAADFYDFMRDGEFIAKDQTPADLHTTGTHYVYVDKTADPRKNHDWSVTRKINGISSPYPIVRSGEITPSTAWLCSEDGVYAFPFVNYDATGLVLGERSAAYDIVGSEELMLVFQGQRGFGGDFSGWLSGAVGTDDADELLADFLEFRKRTGALAILTFANMAIKGVMSSATYMPVVFQEEIVNKVVFRFDAKGEL